MHPDVIDDCERNGYVDGEIDLARRYSVEDRCARNPQLAASLFADLRARTALKLGKSDVGDVPPAILAATKDLQGRLNRQKGLVPNWWSRSVGAVAAICVLTVTASLMLRHGSDTPPPGYIDDALESYQAGLLRQAMASQVESRSFDARDIAQNIKVRVPVLPQGWQISDVQVFPSDQGPALQLIVQTSDRQTMSIFAVRTSEHAPPQPATARLGKMSVAYWRQGTVAYALVGAAAPEELDSAAEDLADNTLA